MRALAESLPELVTASDRVVAVVSILDDKDAAGMLAALLGGTAIDALVLTTSQQPARAAAGHAAVAGPPAARAARPRSSPSPRRALRARA